MPNHVITDPVITDPWHPHKSLLLTKDDVHKYIDDIIDTASSDTFFAQKAKESIRYIIDTYIPDPPPPPQNMTKGRR